MQTARLTQQCKGNLRFSRPVRCCPVRAQAGSAQAAPPPKPSNDMLVKAVELLFGIKPVFEAASRSARQRIVKRAESIGMDFEAQVAALQRINNWEQRLAEATSDVAMPDYYQQPFHAYPQGNLCWEAAMEFEVASRSVHSQVLDPDGKVCDPEGDDKFRCNFMDIARGFMQEAGARSVKDAVDLGCATGLSTAHVRRAFPGSRVVGVDLSPHMVAVGKYLQEQRVDQMNGEQPIQFMHARAEDTGLPAESADLVTLCLVAHELPVSVTRNIFKEAYRLLRPGGALAVMEMDPASPIFQRIFANPAAYVAFKSTEPWLLEYVTLDMPAAMQAAGFTAPQIGANSPRHKTCVAVKPR